MTIKQATAICRQWLPRDHKEHWEPRKCDVRDDFIDDLYFNRIRCPKCSWNVSSNRPYQREHDCPMPPANWDLAGAMLERASELWGIDPRNEMLTDMVQALRTAIPLQATIEAAAEWIQGQKERR